jgi:hypothetical protein
MRKQILVFLTIVAVLFIFAFRSKPLNDGFRSIPYSITNDVSQNVDIRVNTAYWEAGSLRLKFVPKASFVSITKFKIRHTNFDFVDFTELEGNLDFTNREARIIEVNKPFNLQTLSITNLLITAIEGKVSK